jgi:ABC-type amino acid transport substrate-binding protein
MQRIIACTMLAVNLLFPAWVCAETISFVTTEFPPYVIKQGDHLSGFEVEFVRELCRKLGVEAEFTLVPWNRALEYVKQGTVDGILMPVYSQERAEYIYFTDLPVGRERISIMSLPGSGIKAKSLDDLKDKMIGVIFGYSYGQEFDENKALRKVESYDNDLLLKKLNLERYQLIASDEYVINHVARQAGQAELETVLNLKDNPKFLGFSKAIGQRGKDLAKRFTQAIHDLQQDGTLEKIRKRYF